GFASISGFAVLACRWTQATLADRLDILVQALDTTVEAHVLAAPNGRGTYANTAFQQLFSGTEEPLDRIERSLAEDAQSTMEFHRLHSLASAGVRGTTDLSLRNARGGDRFHIVASPIAGWPGYSFWNIRDITARHETETILRAERDKLV